MIPESLLEAGLGLVQGKTLLAPPDPRWAALFEKVNRWLRRGLMDSVVDIQHVGSTAVPELAAKPILDVAVGVKQDSSLVRVKRRLLELGFHHRTYVGFGSTLHELLALEARPRVRVINLHLLYHNSPEWLAYLAFRDTLRSVPALRREYDELKRSLLVECSNDRRSYIAGKTSFVEKVLLTFKMASRPDHGC